MSFRLCTLFIIGFTLSCVSEDPPLFKQIATSHSGIQFANTISSSDSFNILTYEYIYNGGGVAVFDANADGLQDLFFTGNMVENKLYLNQGDLQFRDITEPSRVGYPDHWCSGIAISDVNQDGWPDIYIATNTHPDPALRANLLLIHQGLDEDGIPHFEESAAAYGIADTSNSMNSIFFDYDRDNDLDLFVINNHMDDGRGTTTYEKKQSIDHKKVDRLYRNEWSQSAGHPIFVDVSKEAGITVPGYSLGVSTADVNDDGWIDIYISNDFISNDVLYINQGDGTFSDQASAYFKHTSHSAMGNDVTDINNDGVLDVIALDMLPEDNYRRKTMMGPSNYMTYINSRKFGYDHQYVRNTLQMGQGTYQGKTYFSDIAFMAGIAATDWSWAPVVADFDHDGRRDLIVTNGFPRDITDRDFIDYKVGVQSFASAAFLMDSIPEVKISNYAFRNLDGMKFSNETSAWGLDIPSFSNGAAVGDLDNDGDLDLVVNNIDDPAFLFENTVDKIPNQSLHYLQITLEGPKGNVWGIGAKIKVSQDSSEFLHLMRTSRGYLSSYQPLVHLGMSSENPCLVEVVWPDGKTQLLKAVEVDQNLKVYYRDAVDDWQGSDDHASPLLSQNDIPGLNIKHQEFDFVDFNVQPLLPHKLSQFGPGLAVGDANGDERSDVLLGGSAFYPSILLVQNSGGGFDSIPLGDSPAEHYHEDMGAVFFDADLDGDDDLYIVSGGYEYPLTDSFYLDRFYLNERGVFSLRTDLIPQIAQSGSCVRVADYDRDGDLDLFVGGRHYPHEYPRAVSSYLFENHLEQGSLFFSVDSTSAPALQDIGMISDAVWSDVDGDGWQDLLVAGEWMPIHYLHNEEGRFMDRTDGSGLEDVLGWWNSISAGDLDRDGDMDYVAGNFGDNVIFKVDEKYPIRLYHGDVDDNEGFDAILSVHFPERGGDWKETTLHVRNDVIRQLNYVRSEFITNAAYAKATIADILGEDRIHQLDVLEANYLKSSWIENLGAGKFRIHPLPASAQIAPLYSTLPIDLSGNGQLDLITIGNDYGTEINMGRCDAYHGALFVNDQASFSRVPMSRSGFVVSGDAKGMVPLDIDGTCQILCTQNQGQLMSFGANFITQTDGLSWEPLDTRITYTLDGKVLVLERNWGQGYLSSGHLMPPIPRSAENVVVMKSNGQSRTIQRLEN